MRKTFVILIAFSLLCACSSTRMSMAEKINQLELGISKKEALAIMGDKYRVESVMEVPEGKLEVLFFYDFWDSDYTLYFLNGHLREYHRIVPQPTPPKQEVHVVTEERKAQD